MAQAVVTQAIVTVLPSKTPADIRALQQAEPVIQEIRRYWEQGRRPSYVERQQLSSPAPTASMEPVHGEGWDPVSADLLP